MDYILQSIGILMTVSLLPFALRIFNLNLVKRIKDYPLERALASYKLWNDVRLALIAVPAILNPSIEFDFLEKTGGLYGIIFDPEALANAPQTLEEIYVPTYEPKGFELIEDTAESYGVTYIWTNEEEEVICFDQRALPENPNDTDWLFINSEDTERSLLIENGYMVQIVANKERAQYIGVWTDNRYLYLVTISVFDEDPEPILREIMNSLVQIEKKT